MTAVGEPAAAARRYLPVAERQPVAEIYSTDWRRRPTAVKRYPPAAAIPLPPAGTPPPSDRAGALGPAVLGSILRDSYGLTRFRWSEVPLMPGPDGRPRRPVGSGGGAYPMELYLVGSGGAWHYDPVAHALDPIRSGEPAAGAPGLVLVLAAVFARNVYKYGEFGYRLCCLDAGALTGQLLTLLAVHGLPAAVRPHGAGSALADLLGLDEEVEAPLAVIEVDARAELPSSRVDGVARPTRRTRPQPALGRVPLAAGLHQRVRLGAGGPLPEPLTADLPATVARHPLPVADLALVDGLSRRHSLDGRFGPGSLTREQLGTLLHAAQRWEAPGAGLERVLLRCVVHQVEGIPPGLYGYERDHHRLVALGTANLREAMAPPAGRPDERILGDHGGGVAIVPVGDYERGFRIVGDPWFLLQNLPAGIVAQRVALAAAALGLDSRILCAYETDRLAATLGLAGGPLRPLCQIVVGPRGTEHGYDHPL
jgi:SagB-type dehydrogenase family enzyme